MNPRVWVRKCQGLQVASVTARLWMAHAGAGCPGEPRLFFLHTLIITEYITLLKNACFRVIAFFNWLV